MKRIIAMVALAVASFGALVPLATSASAGGIFDSSGVCQPSTNVENRVFRDLAWDAFGYSDNFQITGKALTPCGGSTLKTNWFYVLHVKYERFVYPGVWYTCIEGSTAPTTQTGTSTYGYSEKVNPSDICGVSPYPANFRRMTIDGYTSPGYPTPYLENHSIFTF